MLEPTTLPSARSLSPCFAATKEAANSGTEVPKATIVMAMMRLSTLNASANPTAPLTIPSAPKGSKMMPPTNIKIYDPLSSGRCHPGEEVFLACSWSANL